MLQLHLRSKENFLEFVCGSSHWNHFGLNFKLCVNVLVTKDSHSFSTQSILIDCLRADWMKYDLAPAEDFTGDVGPTVANETGVLARSYRW